MPPCDDSSPTAKLPPFEVVGGGCNTDDRSLKYMALMGDHGAAGPVPSRPLDVAGELETMRETREGVWNCADAATVLW